MRFIILLVSAVCLAPICLFSQTSTGIQNLPPGFVDGSKNPSQIPDTASYRLVLIQLASVNLSTPNAASRQDANLARVGLSAPDTQILRNHVTAFATAYSQWQAQAGIAPTAAAHQAAQALVLSTRDAILKGLTPDGVSKFASYVETEKAHMVVRP